MFIEVEPRSNAGKSSTEKICTGRETLRLRAKGPATMEDMVGYVYLIPILLGNGFIRAGNKDKATKLNKIPYTLIKAWTLIHCLL